MGFLEKLGLGKLAGGREPVETPESTELDEDDAAKTPARGWGRPARCPICQKRGYLDSIDNDLRVMYQHCPRCFHQWTLTEEDVKAGTLPV